MAVTRSNGRTIPDLTEKDFVVYDEKVPQKIVHFEHESEPLDLLLLLDVSGSMHGFLTDMSTAAQAALRPLGRSDRVALMLFAREAAVRQVFTPDIDVVAPGIAAAVKTQDLGSGTAINSAIVAAAAYMGRQPPTARRAILIVTDNLSLNYRISDEEVLRALYAADSTLDVILIGKRRRPDLPKPGQSFNTDFTPSDVFKLAEQTGGEAIEARQAAESFQLMIERIRLRYRLQYEAPAAAPGSFRHIEVRLSPDAQSRHARAVLRARAGYYAIP